MILSLEMMLGLKALPGMTLVCKKPLVRSIIPA